MGERINYAKLHAYRPNWKWEQMLGSRLCMHWNVRDLQTLDEVISLTPGRTCAVQAGGNLGLFPKRLAEEFTAVFTFEPDPRMYRRLRINSPEANIHPIKAALGDNREPVGLACRRRDGSLRPVHEGLTHISGPGTIKQMLIDDLNLLACDLIYLDIEGYELPALRGAARTIAEHRPVIALEVNGNAAYYGVTKPEIADWLGERGYVKIARRHGDDIYVPKERAS